MSGLTDLLLLVVVVLDLAILASSRLTTCIRASALQGALLAALPAALSWEGARAAPVHVLLLGLGLLALKAFVIPFLLLRALREADVHHEVEPFVSLHVSILLATVLVAISFWLASVLVLPRPAPSGVIVPTALSTLLVGFLILVSRRQAVTQVVGYLMLENGVFVFGQTLIREMPVAAELAILLDLLVGVFIMGIAIHHISREFDSLDTVRLTSLKG
ncbi:MAG TPA: hydrogenase [Candidatus Eisenbacteria bacterium]